MTAGRAGQTDRQRKPYREARAFVRSLGLKTNAEWSEYCRSGQKPDDIPATPERVYSKKWR